MIRLHVLSPQVIVNDSNRDSSMSKREVSRLFLKKSNARPDGTKAFEMRFTDPPGQ